MYNVVSDGLGWSIKMVPRRGLEPPQNHEKDNIKQLVVNFSTFRAPHTLHIYFVQYSICSVLS